MRSEDDFGFDTAEAFHDIDDFRLVTVVSDRVSRDRFVDFAVKVSEFGGSTCAADTGLAIDDYIFRGDQTFFKEW